jgi:hypothetical protein
LQIRTAMKMKKIQRWKRKEFGEHTRLACVVVGALADHIFDSGKAFGGGAECDTRGACAPQNNSLFPPLESNF